MGLFDFLGGGKTVQPQTIDPRNPQRSAADSALSAFISQYLPQYQPGRAYSGQLTARMSPYETQGLGSLQTYMNQPAASPGLSNIQDFLQKTISGGFNPNTSQAYQAFRDEAQRNRALAVRDSSADFGSRGQFFSTAALNKVGDINAQTGMGLNSTMASLADQERNRQMSAVAPATGLEQFLQNRPLQQATAGTTIGSLPRTLNQADLEAKYQDFLRQQKELGGVAGVSGGISSTSTPQGYPLPALQQNSGQQAGQAIGQFLPFIMSLFGG